MPNVELAHMREPGMEWLLRPISRGWARYESLLDRTLDLADIARMNEAIEVEDENRFRVHKAAESK